MVSSFQIVQTLSQLPKYYTVTKTVDRTGKTMSTAVNLMMPMLTVNLETAMNMLMPKVLKQFQLRIVQGLLAVVLGQGLHGEMVPWYFPTMVFQTLTW